MCIFEGVFRVFVGVSGCFLLVTCIFVLIGGVWLVVFFEVLLLGFVWFLVCFVCVFEVFSLGFSVLSRRFGIFNVAWWTFRIFFIFFCLGEGKGESEAPGAGGGGDIVLKIPGGGGGLPGGWRRGGEGPGGCLRGIGGGAKYFFSGPKFPPRLPFFYFGVFEAFSFPVRFRGVFLASA